jgi:hypothetical protein
VAHYCCAFYSRRNFNNLSFKGFRLSPNIWRSVGKALGNDAKLILQLDEHSIKERFIDAKATLKEQYFPSPAAANLKFLFEGIKANRLQLILNRHLDPSRSDKHGTPDLFLFALNPINNRVSATRFVEVKKPEEPLSVVQVEEIQFLREIGLKARLLRLNEM